MFVWWITLIVVSLARQGSTGDPTKPYTEEWLLSDAQPAWLQTLNIPADSIGPASVSTTDPTNPTVEPTVKPRPSPKPHRNHHGKEKEDLLFPYLRYLWWLVVLYFFWAQALVCDEYFVPTIQVIGDTFGIPDDIAGATIMALGCNGPELFINTVALFRKSDLGIGAVLGGEVFNLLVLCGCAVVATPVVYMPLQIPKFSFSRDVFFYALSIGLIYWVLYDGVVTLTNVIVLLSSGVLYSCVVIVSPHIRNWIDRVRSSNPPLQPQECLQVAEQTENVDSNRDPEHGCFLGVRVHMGNRMQDRCRYWDTRFVTLKKEGLVVSTDVRDKQPMKYGRTQRGIVFQRDLNKGTGNWRHGGLINAPMFTTGSGGEDLCRQWSGARLAASHVEGGMADGSSSSFCEARASSDPEIAVQAVRSELIRFHDLLVCVAPTNPQSTLFELQVLQRNGGLDKEICLEFDARSCATRERWVSSIRFQMQLLMQTPMLDACSDTNFSANASCITLGPSARPAKGWLMEWADWIRFPVKFVLRVTIPNVKNERWRKCNVLSFIMSMAWLALFSFCVVEVCDILADEFKISVTLLGYTVAAVGTSFPNVVSCVAVSRQGKTLMAIANALGANIQNVFIALALPWLLHSILHGPFPVRPGSNFTASVIAMFSTLALLLLVVLAARCRMPRWAGIAFLVMYFGYLIVTFGEEFGCLTWPVCQR